MRKTLISNRVADNIIARSWFICGPQEHSWIAIVDFYVSASDCDSALVQHLADALLFLLSPHPTAESWEAKHRTVMNIDYACHYEVQFLAGKARNYLSEIAVFAPRSRAILRYCFIPMFTTLPKQQYLVSVILRGTLYSIVQNIQREVS